MRTNADDQKLRVLEAMKKAHEKEGHWLKLSNVRSYAGNMDYYQVKRTIYELASEGWLNMRDPDTNQEIFLVQLRKEYR